MRFKRENFAVYVWLLFVIALCLIYLIAGVVVFAQEIKGPEKTTPGRITVFEIEPACPASWIVTPLDNNGCYYVDTSGSKIYFSSPAEGTFTIIAAIIVKDKERQTPLQLVATITNSSSVDSDTDKKNDPDNKPQTDLAAWIADNTKTFYTGPNPEQINIIFDCFAATVDRIDRGSIKSATSARTQLTIEITSKLALAGGEAVNDWLAFVGVLSDKLKLDLGDKIDDLDAVKLQFRAVANCKQVNEPAPKQSAPTEPAPAPVQQQQSCTTGQCPTTYYYR